MKLVGWIERRLLSGSVNTGALQAAARFLFAGCLVTLAANAAESTFQESNGELLLRTSRWGLGLDARTGNIRRIEDRSRQGILMNGGNRLWTIDRQDNPPVSSTNGTFCYQWEARLQHLNLPDNRITPLVEARTLCRYFFGNNDTFSVVSL